MITVKIDKLECSSYTDEVQDNGKTILNQWLSFGGQVVHIRVIRYKGKIYVYQGGTVTEVDY